MKLVVLGCGPTALGLTYRLQDLIESSKISALDVEITVIEKESHPGGLAYSVKDDQGFLWDFGIHATFSHYDYYDKALDWAVQDWNFLTRNAELDMAYMFGECGLRLLPYPVQYSVPLFPQEQKEKCMREMKVLHGNEKNCPGHGPLSYDDWVLKSFGPTLADVFFRPYNKKLWTVDIKEMNSTWVGDRVAQVDLKLLEDLCSKDKKELESQDYGWGPNAKFRYPKHGGVGAVWKAIQEKLPEEWFRFEMEAVSIDPKEKLVTVRNRNGEKEVISYDFLISTIPITFLGRISGLAPNIQLKHNRVIVVGIGFKSPQPKWMETKSWLYFPGDDVPFYRISMLSNYSCHMTPKPGECWSILFEVARSPDQDGQWDKELIAEECVDATIRKGFAKDKSEIVSLFSKVLPFGYPIPTLNRDAELKAAHGILEPQKIFSRGRFGGWKYEVSNQDHSFMQGKEVLDRILFGTPETVYSV